MIKEDSLHCIFFSSGLGLLYRSFVNVNVCICQERAKYLLLPFGNLLDNIESLTQNCPGLEGTFTITQFPSPGHGQDTFHKTILVRAPFKFALNTCRNGSMTCIYPQIILFVILCVIKFLKGLKNCVDLLLRDMGQWWAR